MGSKVLIWFSFLSPNLLVVGWWAPIKHLVLMLKSLYLCNDILLQVEFETELMQDKRDKLTSLLMDLMERQKQRAEDLQRMMGEMETEKEEQQDHYWLIQYQKLLDSKPKGLEKAEGNMDPKVKQMLMACGAEELLPVFAKKKVTYKEATFLTEVDLKQMGVGSGLLRRRVLAAVVEVCRGEDAARHNLEGGAGAHKAAASAPEEETSAPSAPEDTEPSAPVETFQSAECVVCMERKVGCHGLR